jgi:hypothetical protein
VRTILTALLILLAFAPVVVAQQPAVQPVTVVPEEQRATEEDVVALLDVMHSRRQTAAALDMMKEQMLTGMRLGFLKEHPGASPAVLKKLDATMDGVWNVVSVDEIVKATIPVYRKYLSHEDAISLISFYSSPAGQDYLARMPALIKEAGEAGGKLMSTHLDEVQRESKAKYAEFEKYVAAHPDEMGTAPIKGGTVKP